jgi:methionyl-tRNA synthetase
VCGLNSFCTGNLLNRTLGLLKKNCQSTLAVDSAVAAEGNALKDTIEKLVRLHEICDINVVSMLDELLLFQCKW